MKKFMALYMMPIKGLEEWQLKDATERKAAEEEMQKEWGVWMQEHKAELTGITAGIGKTKRITEGSIVDTKNEIMLYSMVEADTHDDATKIFEKHPHLKIPGSWIDIMPINPLPGMEGM
jgi:uncharacterized protein (UPF0254 family)